MLLCREHSNRQIKIVDVSVTGGSCYEDSVKILIIRGGGHEKPIYRRGITLKRVGLDSLQIYGGERGVGYPNAHFAVSGFYEDIEDGKMVLPTKYKSILCCYSQNLKQVFFFSGLQITFSRAYIQLNSI